MEMNKIVAVVKSVLLVLPVALLLVGGILLAQTPDKKNKVDWKNTLKKVWIVVLVAAIVYVGCFAGVRGVQGGMEGSITIRLNYAEASRGLNPNGTRFNTYDIISDTVLEAAIAEENMGITPQELRAALSVEPLEAGNRTSAEQYYVSTEYVLRYDAAKKTQHLNGEKVLLAVAGAYGDAFREQYSRKTNVMELDFSGLSEADYLDQVDLLDKYASDVSDYLKMCSKENKTFTHSDGETFSSLAAKVDNLSKVDLERLESYILVKGLSKDADRQVSKLNYLNLIKDINADKNTASYNIRLEAIQMYERDMATIVLIPTREDGGEFYMSRTKIGVDVFSDEAEDYSEKASLAKTYISTNNYAISQLLYSGAAEADYATADAMVETLKANLLAYAQKGLDMVAAYDASAAGTYLDFNLDTYDPLSTGNLVKYVFLFGLMGVSSGVFVVALQNKKSGKKQ